MTTAPLPARHRLPLAGLLVALSFAAWLGSGLHWAGGASFLLALAFLAYTVRALLQAQPRAPDFNPQDIRVSEPPAMETTAAAAVAIPDQTAAAPLSAARIGRQLETLRVAEATASLEPRQPGQASPLPAWQAEAFAALEQVLAANRRQQRKKTLIFWSFFVVLFTALWVAFYLGTRDVGAAWFWGGMLTVFISAAFLPSRVVVSAAQYYSIPHSQSPEGRPHCIHCGHYGVHAHGIYGQDGTLHDCTKCGTTLYCS